MKGNNKMKNNDDIAAQWDQVAEQRFTQLQNHKDISMDNIIIPLLNKMITHSNVENVIDFGCGTGYITNKIKPKPLRFTGIDISSKSIKIAQNNFKNNKFFDFLVSSIEDFPELKRANFTLGICNMTLMDVGNLNEVVSSMARVLKKKSTLAITITHPYFWPFYWDYAEKDWFSYDKEIEVSNQFKISNATSEFETTHYHRPLELYINLLTKNGFRIEQIFEPMPNENISKMYSASWKFPRFLGIKCIKD